MAKTALYVDASELDSLLDDMKKKVGPENFDRLMRRTVNEVGKGMKKPIAREVMKDYAVTKPFVYRGIKKPYMKFDDGGPACVIPLEGEKGHIGGTFKAFGGHPGWNPPKYSVRARIVKSGISTLPSVMSHQGGNPPFINTSASKLNGVAFTRTGGHTKNGKPAIASISGLALPQMPMNRASPEIEKEILERLEKRAVHNFGDMFG